MEITDKELLAICNLSNLKMEFADVVKEKQRVPDPNNNGKFIEKILSNHTIYSLIENELNGQKIRDSIREKENNMKLFKQNLDFIEYNSHIGLDSDEIYLQNNIEKKYIQENLGSFFRITDKEQKKYIYQTKKDLIREAPLLMEYFDSYCEATNKEENVGKFLNDWEVIFGGDNYAIGKKTLEIVENKLVITYKKEIPTREEVELAKSISSIADKINTFLESPYIAEIAGEYIPKITIPKFNQEISYEDILKIEKNILNRQQKKYEVKKILNKEISLVDEGVRIVICRNKKLKKIVISFQNNEKIQYIDTNLDKKIFPKELFLLEEIYLDLKQNIENKDYEIIFTGVGVAGKLANLYGISCKEKSKSFTLFPPNNLNNITTFSLDNFEELINNLKYYSYSTDLILEGEKLAVKTLFYQIFIFISAISLKKDSRVNIIKRLLISCLTSIGNIFKNILSVVSDNRKNLKIQKSQNQFMEKLKNYGVLNEDGTVTEKIKSTEYCYTYINKDMRLENLQIDDFLLLISLEYLSNYSIDSYEEFNKINKKENSILIFKNNDSEIELKVFFDKNSEGTYIDKILYLDSFLTKDDEKIFIGFAMSIILRMCKEFKEDLENNPYENINYFTEETKELKEKYSIYNQEDENKRKFLLNLELLFAPYLDSSTEEIILNKISEEYTASFIRSCFNFDEDYNEKNISERIEDEDYDLILFGISTSLDKETLNESLFKIMEDRGKKIALPEHYESVMKEFKENPKLIEKYYVIEEDKYSKNRAELNLGIFNEMKSYAPERMGFAYSSLDKIRVGLTRVPLYFLDKVDVSSIKTTKVCSGAILECNCGTAPKELVVTSQGNYTADGRLIATKEDKQRLLNIGDFGSCKCKDNKPCKYFISLKEWNEVSPNNRLNGKNILLSSSTISCNVGGVIEIKDSKCKFNAN